MRTHIKIIFYIAILLFAGSHHSFAGQIAITIDDAPSPDSVFYNGSDRIKTIVKKLSKLKIKQTMIFATGKYINRDNGFERLKIYADNGHLIANHTYEHFNFSKVTDQEYSGDILKDYEFIKGFPTFSRFFRYPFLQKGNTVEKRDALRNFLKEQNLRNGYVTVLDCDWYICKLVRHAKREGKKINFENLKKLYVDHMWSAIMFYDKVAAEYLGRSPKHTLLMHDVDTTALFIDDLVKYIRGKGWEIITPVEAYQDPIANYSPKTLLGNYGRVMALAIDKGYKGQYYSWKDSESINAMFKKYKVW